MSVRNAWRVATFDVAAPAVAIGAVLLIGAELGWPRWWVAAAAVLVLLIVQAVLINVVFWRRDAVTVGTDDDRPGLRLAVAGVATLAIVAAVAVGYQRWTVPDRAFAADATQVVRIATDIAEVTASFSPSDPDAAVAAAEDVMVPERVAALKKELAAVTEQMLRDKVSTRAVTVSAGLEALGPDAASVVVLVRSSRTEADRQPERRVLALRVALTKPQDRWLVLDVVPIR